MGSTDQWNPTAGGVSGWLSSSVAINMFWDRLFHAFTWLMTVVGLWLLRKAVRRRDVALPTGALVGSLAMGWGIFNLVEGIINHHILNLHHVVERPDHLPWDIAFLVGGVVLILIGLSLIRGGRQRNGVRAGRQRCSCGMASTIARREIVSRGRMVYLSG